MGNILLDGLIVNYEAVGRGKPVIFLHSWVGSWSYWYPAMQFISKSFRAYALDMCGFGETSRDPARYTIDKQTYLLNRFLDEMSIAKVAIIGHGLGALVGLHFCVRWPQSVDRIMAVSCPLYDVAINSRLRTSSLPDLIQWLRSRSPEAKTLLDDASKADPMAIAASIESFQSNDLFDQIRQTLTSCLLAFGQNDPAIAVPTTDSVSTWPLMVHQVVFERSGHFPMIDEGNRFNHLLMDFLVLDSGASPRELRE